MKIHKILTILLWYMYLYKTDFMIWTLIMWTLLKKSHKYKEHNEDSQDSNTFALIHVLV